MSQKKLSIMSYISNNSSVEIKTTDETNSLNELFNVVNDKSHVRQKPLNERKLPESFFVPPFGKNDNLMTNPAHSKAFSSPATLEETNRAGQQYINHSKQLSLDSQNSAQNYSDLTNNISSNNNNFNLKSSDPNKPHLNYAIKKLPENFELSIDEENRVYFLNHSTKSTTWFDPRLPDSVQTWGMSLEQLDAIHLKYASNLRKQQHQQQSQSTTSSVIVNTTTSSSSNNQSLVSSDYTKNNVHFRSCSQPISSSSTSAVGTTQNPMSHLHNTTITTSNTQQQQMVNTYNHHHQQGGIHHRVPPTQYNNNQYNNQHTTQIHHQQQHTSSYSTNPIHSQQHFFKQQHQTTGSNNTSSNSSCSNLSSCLNGLNLSSPYNNNNNHPSQHHHQLALHHQQLLCGPPINNLQQQHTHQDSLDSGVGQSVISHNNLPPNMDERFALDATIDDFEFQKNDDLMDVEIMRTMNQ